MNPDAILRCQSVLVACDSDKNNYGIVLYMSNGQLILTKDQIEETLKSLQEVEECGVLILRECNERMCYFLVRQYVCDVCGTGMSIDVTKKRRFCVSCGNVMSCV